MKKQFLLLAGLTLAGQVCFAQTDDSMRVFRLKAIEVVATRAMEKTPVAYTDLKKDNIQKLNNGVDMPFLLTSTPSVVVTSDAGAGVGYTGVRIRGADATRINVTANGIPMNDAESHGLFWVNTPDFAASVEDIQIQRGVGTSTNGAGAFGGSINMKTVLPSTMPYAMVSGTYGSFNTHRESVDVGTGLLGGRWIFNARLSNIGSDGYIDRASTKLKSYFFQANYYGNKTIVRLINFAGTEETYHAWNGLTKDEMAEYGRRHNTCGEIKSVVRDANGVPVLDSYGNVKTVTSGYYDDQTDNYTQSNYQMLVTHKFGNRINMNLNFHYTDGDGYYEEYKNARTLTEYGLLPFVPQDPAKEAYMKGGKVVKSDLVRRKIMDNWFGGAVFSLNYTSKKLQASLGGAANKYDGDHFGRVIWARNYAGDPGFATTHEYYRNNGTKLDYNVYMRADWRVTDRLNLYGDVQYRHIDYKIDGANDNWDWNVGAMQKLAVDKNFDFINPKAGLNYQFAKNFNAYASFSMAGKEPTRNNYTDAKKGKDPKAEKLMDYEAGVNYRSGIFSAGVNYYYMKYKDQLVLTGEVNHIGEPLSDNVKDSYRTGIELTAGIQPLKWLRWDVNATFSRNRIKGYTEFLDDVDADYEPLYTQTSRYVGGTDISFSPEVLVGSLISATYRNLTFSFQSNYVGDQYLTNSMQDDAKLDAYFVNNLRLNYRFKLPCTRFVDLGVAVNNIFDEKYCSNGYAGSSNVISAGGTERANWSYYFPQAGTNVLATLTLRF